MRKLSRLTLLLMMALAIFSSCQKEEEISSDEAAEHALIEEAISTVNTEIPEEHWTIDDLPGDGIELDFDPTTANERDPIFEEETCESKCVGDGRKMNSQIWCIPYINWNYGNPKYDGVTVNVFQALTDPNAPDCDEDNWDLNQTSMFYYSIKHWTVNQSPMKTLKAGVFRGPVLAKSVTKRFPQTNQTTLEGFLVYLYRYEPGNGWCKVNSTWWTVKNEPQ